MEIFQQLITFALKENFKNSQRHIIILFRIFDNWIARI